MKRFLLVIAVYFTVMGQNPVAAQNTQPVNARDAHRPRYVFVPRNDSKPGDEKVVTVPGIERRQAMLDAQTYHIGWVAVDAWEGQNRVLYNVLIRKTAPDVSGSVPRARPVPGTKKLPRRRS